MNLGVYLGVYLGVDLGVYLGGEYTTVVRTSRREGGFQGVSP